MAKSVYSLVLSDDVVKEVDRLAYTMNTSRSNMINRILAEYVSMETAEKRMKDVFQEIENLLMGSGSFQMLMKPSDSMMSLRSALSYKYNPTIRYSIESVNGNDGIQEVRLKILLRSQSSTLIGTLREFFRLWENLEKRETSWQIMPARYIRQLTLPREVISGEEYGERIALYIQTLDMAMKAFFAALSDPEEAIRQVERIYRDYEQKIDYEL